MTDKATDVTVTLKSCPFCDGKAEEATSKGPTGERYRWIQCTDCGAMSECCDDSARQNNSDEPEPIDLWNTRTAHSGEGRETCVNCDGGGITRDDNPCMACGGSGTRTAARTDEGRSNGAGEDAAKVEADEYLVCKNGYYYRPNAAGYTYSVEEAGRFTLERAIRESHPNGPNGPRDGITYELAPPRGTLSAPQGEVERIADIVESRISAEFKGFWTREDLVEEIPGMIREAARAALAQPEAGGEHG